MLYCHAICIVKVLLVWWLLSGIAFTCLQYIFLAFDLYDEHVPSCGDSKSFMTLLFSTQCDPVFS